MKVKSIIIGEYSISPSVSFCLYQLNSPYITPPLQKEERNNFYCLEDLFSLFDIQFIKEDLSQLFKSDPECFLKDINKNQHLVESHILLKIALKYNISILIQLFQLNESQLVSGDALHLLKSKSILRLFTKPIIKSYWNPHIVEVKSDTFFLNYPIPSPQLRMKRLSFDFRSSSSSIQNMAQLSSPILPKIEEHIPKPSSLLLKRLAPKHAHKRNLTIFTPSYNENETMIHSAPLKRSTVLSKTKNSKIMKKTTLSPPTKRLKVPSTAVIPRFPSPPIVPSQQPTPFRQTHKITRPTIKTATTPYFPHHHHHPHQHHHQQQLQQQPPPPPPPALTQKQKFLQPFEYLYDNIEQTRTLKMTLDDQIRKSSNLIQQLQKIDIQTIVQKETESYLQKEFKDRIQECASRIEMLEYKSSNDIPISPAISPPPPATSMNSLLSQLLKRVDQLESKLAAEKSV